MGDGTSFLSSSNASLLEIAGLRVVWVWEFVDERHVVVESAARVKYCRECGQRAESVGARRCRCGICRLPERPRADVSQAGVALPRLSAFVARDLGADPAAGAAHRAGRREAARQVGEEGRSVAEVARGLGVGWEPVMRAVRDEARRRFAEAGLYTVQTRPCVALGIDEKVMNRANVGADAAT